MIIIFSGSTGRLPYGGHAWIDMQYLTGLSALGHDVFYLEECGKESWVYDWDAGQLTTDLHYPAGYVRACLQPLGLGDKWIYRAGDASEGMDNDEFKDVCSRADLMLIRAVPLPLWRPEYALPRSHAFIDADPGFTQISLANGHRELQATIERCGRLFTVGQRVGLPDCSIPTVGREWLKTLPPVSLPYWPWAEDEQATHFTSVMHWRGFRDVEYGGAIYGQKDREFPKFIGLPRLTEQPFRVALTGGDPAELAQHGWEVIEGWKPSRTPEMYRSFIAGSRAEFGVAKHGYVAMRSGWFSDRSVCYLASGRPALVEDTGLEDWLPLGEGLLTFRDVPGALQGIDAINADYERHRRAARRLAEEIFNAERVLPPLIAEC
ncbi:MAG TPA: glycosyltransferase family 1 protein [Chloroflexia bacterium]|nr:glycosyltransferase family 1 protein [Chloroflexia bacterium]